MRRTARWPLALAASGVLVLGLLALAAWRLLQQEQALERERLRERLENAAVLVISASQRALAQASSDERSSLSLEWNELGVRRSAGVPLLWLPALQHQAESEPRIYSAGEQLEFAGRQTERAMATYRELLGSPDRAVRAGALLRIARCQRTLRRTADALATYQQLSALQGVAVAGAPAELVGRRERMVLLDRDFPATAASERDKLRALLESGTIPIDRATFEFFAQAIPIAEEIMNWARAAEVAWKKAGDGPVGPAMITVKSQGSEKRFVSDWSRNGLRGSARILSFDALLPRMERTLDNASLLWQLQDDGHVLGGHGVLANPTLTKRPAETGLPWTIAVAVPTSTSSRQDLLIAAAFVLGLVLLATCYLAYRFVRRELDVAQMQSEFVAAVSHEFRSPITALIHLTDLLESGDPPSERRGLYYKALARETRRLRDMVENLLDFGRLEAGHYRYKPELLEASGFVRSIVDEFETQPSAAGHEIRFHGEQEGIAFTADPEAIRRAIWNLLDNAAKYSPSGTRIALDVSSKDGWVAMSVQDNGCGIAPEDRKKIFQKFVRGSSTGSEQPKGTGIGLAMTQAIVKAHHGRIVLESQPGAGSRFTILLPAERRRQ